ncbi:hypothetical protein EDC04DRAFT_1024187 [Pisolithus marmoratus]|nr:hypothetical protein EDC04DRAFT_1024187 [Pisolithus marmoratus]
MPPPVAVWVVVAVAGVAAAAAFHQFVYEPHIAPAIEAWAEDFVARRRSARNAGTVPVPTRRRRRRPRPSSSGSSNSSPSTTRGAARGSPRDDPSATGTRRATRRPTGTRGRTGRNSEIAESYELEGLIAHDVEEWRNEVRRTQDASGLRHRRGLGLGGRMNSPNDYDLDHISTTLDESFTELTHTPINPTHVISNVSSPVSSDSLSLPSVPHSPARAHLNIRNRSGSTTTITATAVQEQELHTSQQTERLFAIPSSPPAALPKSPDRTTEPDTDTVPPSSLTSPRLITIPPIGSPSSAFDSSPVPRPRPGYTTLERDDDSPFGPLLPDTPRSSPALYAGRPFSPIVTLTGSTSSPVVPGTEIVNSPPFSRSSSTGRRGSTLSHEIFPAEHNGTTDDVENSSFTDLGHGNTPIHSRTHSPRHTSSPRCQAPNAGVHPLDPDYTNPNSSIASLSLRYPVPPMSPVMVSPPPSEGVRSLSNPSSRSSTSPPISEELRSLSSLSSRELMSPEWTNLPVPASPASASASPELVRSPESASPVLVSSSPVVIPSSSLPGSAFGVTGLGSSASTLRVPQPPMAGSRQRSNGPSPMLSSPTASYASFASFATPASAVRTVSSMSDIVDADFLSAADSDGEDDDERGIGYMAPHVPLRDRAYNPFLDFEEVFEVGSDDSDGDDRGSDGSGSDGSWGSHGSAGMH